MGRLENLTLIRAIVRTVIMANMKNNPATRHTVMEHVTSEFGVSERSFAKALAQIEDSGILVKNKAEFLLDDLTARGKRRKGVRTELIIDVVEAIKRLLAIWSEQLISGFDNYPEEVRGFMARKYATFKSNELLGELAMAKEALDKWGRSGNGSMTPGEIVYWNVVSYRVMDYISELREKNRSDIEN